MPTIHLHLFPTPNDLVPPPHTNPLPQLLHTPLGLALLELQGSINTPPPLAGASETAVGSLTFPPGFGIDTNRRVYLYIGANQRMTGELRKLATPVGVLRRRKRDVEMEDAHEGEEEWEGGKWDGEELEVAEVVHWKVVFATRPEPVGSGV